MDALDEQLITLLRHDARRSISDLAIELGVSRATVRSRVERLEKTGVIIGYTVILRTDAVDQSVRGIMMVEIEGHAADRVIRALGGFSEVSTIHTTNGRWDLVIELSTQTLTRVRRGSAACPADPRHHRQRNKPASGDAAQHQGAALSRASSRAVGDRSREC